MQARKDRKYSSHNQAGVGNILLKFEQNDCISIKKWLKCIGIHSK
jgi:hypothetical protein